MKGRLFALCIACCAHALWCPRVTSARDMSLTFGMGGFTVNVETIGLRGSSTPITLLPVRPSELRNKFFWGNGSITIKGSTIPVEFSDVQLTISSLTPVRVKAVAGTVYGVPDGGTPEIGYDLDAFHIHMIKSTVALTPTQGVASVSVRLSLGAFTSAPNTAMTLVSPSCEIGPDGSVHGTNFRPDVASSSLAFALKGSRYEMRIASDDDQAVCMGPYFETPHLTWSGARIKGLAFRESLQIFSIQSHIAGTADTGEFTLTLDADAERHPEPGYDLTLKRGGTLVFNYGASGVLTVGGSLPADIKAPETAVSETGQRIELTNVILKPDVGDALSGLVQLPARLRVGFQPTGNPADAPFLLEPAPDATLVYFSYWYSPTGSTSYMGKDPNDNCKSVNELLDPFHPTLGPVGHNIDKRPGLTVTAGTFFLYAEQILTTAGWPEYVYNLKTPFHGALTLTPWGVTGNLTSTGYSFIAADQDIAQCSQPVAAPPATWQQILDAGENRPMEPQERFQFAGLRVLEMYIASMQFCGNEIQSSAFRYKVHFPFPSFIALEFEDFSLDHQGRFHTSKGPIGSKSIEFADAPTKEEIARLPFETPKGDREIINPEALILWAWRLPVAFADRGVVVDFDAVATNPLPDVTVTMDLARITPEGISSSEICLRPLYSANSAFKCGVRFSAKMTPEGVFTLTDWDRRPFLLKSYAVPGTERFAGFACQLNAPAKEGIVLADPEANPVFRSFDHQWNGRVQLPFFSELDTVPDTWEAVSFDIKDLMPATEPLDVEGSRSKVECGSTALSGSISNLQYQPEANSFLCVSGDDLHFIKDGQPVPATYAHISSFTRAVLHLNTSVHENYEIKRWTRSPDGRKEVRVVLEDSVRSTGIEDFVCYDADANAVRNLLGMCCNGYRLGTYVVMTRRYAGDTERVIMSVPHVVASPMETPTTFELQGTTMALYDDEMGEEDIEARSWLVDISPAKLIATDGVIEGTFGVSMPTLAKSLPYEGVVRFRFDTNSGYYYFMGGGTFTYRLRFSGTFLFIHAPRYWLEDVPDVRNMMEDLRIRSLFASVSDLEEIARIKWMDSATVITGHLTAGNASCTIGDPVGVVVAAGSGNYLFQFKSAGSPVYRVGTFMNASAGVDLIFIEVEAIASLGPAIEWTFDGLDSMNFEIRGTLTGRACGSILVGHCEGCVCTCITFNSDSGFDFGGIDLNGHCGAGDCSGCEDCGGCR